MSLELTVDELTATIKVLSSVKLTDIMSHRVNGDDLLSAYNKLVEERTRIRIQ